MTRWQKLIELLDSQGQEATESERRLTQHGLDAALDTVLSEGRALIASLATTDGEGRVEHVNRLREDDLRSVAYAAADSVTG
jgi:hypothetical protein